MQKSLNCHYCGADDHLTMNQDDQRVHCDACDRHLINCISTDVRERAIHIMNAMAAEFTATTSRILNNNFNKRDFNIATLIEDDDAKLQAFEDVYKKIARIAGDRNKHVAR